MKSGSLELLISQRRTIHVFTQLQIDHENWVLCLRSCCMDSLECSELRKVKKKNKQTNKKKQPSILIGNKLI